MNAAERTMPITVATWNPMARRWTVALPLGVAIEAATPADVEELARRHAPGSAVAFIRPALRGEPVDVVGPPQRRTGLSAEHTTTTAGETPASRA